MTLCICGHTEQEHLEEYEGKRSCGHCPCINFNPAPQKSPYPCDTIDWSDYAPDEMLDDE